jgi:hypothetical protein
VQGWMMSEHRLGCQAVCSWTTESASAVGRRNQHQQLDHHIASAVVCSPQLSRSLALCWPSLSAHPRWNFQVPL